MIPKRLFLLNPGLTIVHKPIIGEASGSRKKKKKGALIRKIGNLGLGKLMSKDQLQRFFSTTAILKGKKRVQRCK